MAEDKFIPGKVNVIDMKYNLTEKDGWLLGKTGLGYHQVEYGNPKIKPDYWPTHIGTGCQIGGNLSGLPLKKCRAFLLEIKDMAPWTEITTQTDVEQKLVQTGILRQINNIARRYQ